MEIRIAMRDNFFFLDVGEIEGVDGYLTSLGTADLRVTVSCEINRKTIE